MRTTGRSAPASSISLLCSMIDPGGGAELGWTAAELGEIAEHALAAPLAADLERSPEGSAARQAAGRGTAGALQDSTLGQLLADPSPRRERLALARLLVKEALEEEPPALPREVGKALYAALVAKARVSGHPTLSRLGDAEFTRLARWCLAQAWAPAAIRDVVRRALGSGVPR